MGWDLVIIYSLGYLASKAANSASRSCTLKLLLLLRWLKRLILLAGRYDKLLTLLLSNLVLIGNGIPANFLKISSILSRRAPLVSGRKKRTSRVNTPQQAEKKPKVPVRAKDFDPIIKGTILLIVKVVTQLTNVVRVLHAREGEERHTEKGREWEFMMHQRMNVTAGSTIMKEQRKRHMNEIIINTSYMRNFFST